MYPGLPNLTSWNHIPRSGQCTHYNCVAWAIGCDYVNLWPDGNNHWPEGLAREETLECFIALFESLGFELTDNNAIESQYWKIAIYIDSGGEPTHVARQLRNGNWVSKINIFFDIEHKELSVLEDGDYGRVAQYMRRARTGRPPVLPPLIPPAPKILLP